MFNDLMHIFVPDKHQLSDGKEVKEPFSWMPYVVIGFILLTWLCLEVTGFNLGEFLSRIGAFFEMVANMIPPKWSFWESIQKPMLDTIVMSLLGTIIGCAIALPVSFYLGNNFKYNKIYMAGHKGLLSLLRTLPTLVYAKLISIVIGTGNLAGVLSITIFTFTICVKMLYEQIDTVDMGPYEALSSTGASRLRCIICGIFPQIKGYFLSTVLYCFETNIRSASVLGYVGAGGIGTQIQTQLGFRNYQNVGLILFVLVIVVASIEAFSRYMRRRLADG